MRMILLGKARPCPAWQAPNQLALATPTSLSPRASRRTSRSSRSQEGKPAAWHVSTPHPSRDDIDQLCFFVCFLSLSLSLSLSLPQVDRFGTYIYSHQATVAIVLRKSDFQCRTYNTDSSRHKPHAISCQSKSLLSQVCS